MRAETESPDPRLGFGPSNIGWNVALWVDAVAGDILNRSPATPLGNAVKDIEWWRSTIFNVDPKGNTIVSP